MNEFEKIVLEMRKAQKNYFKQRAKYWLVKSKEWESQVDKYLDDKLNPGLF